MIGFYFWYIVSCNILVQFSGLNLIYVLIPGCGTAAIAGKEDAYEYPEENTDLETFSPEVTDPIAEDLFDEATEGVEEVSAFDDISPVSAESEDTNGGSDVGNSLISEVTTPLTFVSEQPDNSSVAITETSDVATSSETSTNCSDAATKSSDIPTFAVETEATPLPTFVSEQRNNSSEVATKTSDEITTTNCSDASTKLNDIPTEAIETEATTLPTFVSEQTNNSFDLEVITTSETSTSCSNVSTKLPDLPTEPITEETTPSPPPILSKQINENSSVTNNDLCTDSITNSSDSYTINSTTQLIAANDQIDNTNSESTTPQTQALVSEQTSQITELMKNSNESIINNATEFEQIVETSSKPISSPEDIVSSSKKLNETQNVVEISTEPGMLNSSTPKLSTNNSLERLYDELGETRSTFSPIYEEGYHDPEKAPTRYGQAEEYIMTTNWNYVSDYTIGVRDYNLILYAVNNSAVLEKGSLLNYVYFVFKEILHVNITLIDIRYCKYLRSKNPDAAKKVPPVLVAFTKMDVKNEILHKRKLLKPTGIKVEHDMPRKLLDEQNALLKPLMDKYRAMGQYVVVRSGKLLVEGKVLTEISLPDKYTYDPLQTFVSYVSTKSAKTTTPGMQLPREFVEYGFGAEKKSGKKKGGGKAAGGKKKRKPMIRIPLDEEIGEELSAEVLFTTRRFW
ncbi:mucin-2-like [Planococcus citri]|uniref:mucin-2-like n=1 Tax=Planococcus citri TaxID=170843 RepID=UPI0031F77ABD